MYLVNAFILNQNYSLFIAGKHTQLQWGIVMLNTIRRSIVLSGLRYGDVRKFNTCAQSVRGNFIDRSGPEINQ